MVTIIPFHFVVTVVTITVTGKSGACQCFVHLHKGDDVDTFTYYPKVVTRGQPFLVSFSEVQVHKLEETVERMVSVK